MTGKRAAIRDDESRKEWAETKALSGCTVCGRPSACWRGWSVHHILPGRCGRSDEPTNWLFVCAICHDLLEKRQIRNPKTKAVLQTIPLGLALTIKLVRNYEDWSSERLAILSGVRLPSLLAIPAWIENEYRRNHPDPFRPWRPEHKNIVESVNAWIDSYEISR